MCVGVAVGVQTVQKEADRSFLTVLLRTGAHKPFNPFNSESVGLNLDPAFYGYAQVDKTFPDEC